MTPSCDVSSEYGEESRSQRPSRFTGNGPLFDNSRCGKELGVDDRVPASHFDWYALILLYSVALEMPNTLAALL